MYAKYAEMHHSAARGRLRGGADFSNRRDEYARFVGSVPGGIVSLGAPPFLPCWKPLAPRSKAPCILCILF